MTTTVNTIARLRAAAFAPGATDADKGIFGDALEEMGWERAMLYAVRLGDEMLSGYEIWLVSNPEDVEAAFAAEEEDCPRCQGSGEGYWEGAWHSGACPCCHGSGIERCALDRAADAAQDAVTLAAEWGSDVPDERDEEWLAEMCARCAEPDLVREYAGRRWEDRL